MSNRLNKTPYQPDLNDAVALQVNWTPLTKGGASFSTYEIKEVFNGKLKFQVTSFAKKIYFLYIISGAVLLLSGLYIGNFIVSLVGFLLLTLSTKVVLNRTTPIIFDKTNGLFWKGHKKPPLYHRNNSKKIFDHIKNVYAIQITSQYRANGSDRYYSHELNLILNDVRRINILNHRDKKSVINTAKKLSNFLNIPIWDAKFS